MRKKLKIALLACAVAPMVSATEGEENSIRLVCSIVSAVDGSNPVERVYNVDMNNNTVNRWPAKITDAEIKWTIIRTKGANYRLTINRFTGGIMIASDNSRIGTGTCKPAGERKF